MAIKVFNQYRIRRSLSQASAMKKLVDGNVFAQYKDIIMISAIIGYNENRYVPIDKFSEPILMQFFKDRDYDIIDLIVFSHKKDQSVLKEQEKYEVFESYANGGFPILLKKLGLENIEDIETFSDEDTRNIQKKYYNLLISDSFLPKKVEVTDEDLFI